MGDHSSRRAVADALKQPTRATGGNTPICRPYSVLLPVGFAVPPPLPAARCALAAPFHPCLFLAPLAGSSDIGGLLSVALSLGSPPPGVTRHRRSAEPGLSSRIRRYPRPPDPLAAGSLVVPLRLWQQQWSLRLLSPATMVDGGDAVARLLFKPCSDQGTRHSHVSAPSNARRWPLRASSSQSISCTWATKIAR